MMDDVEKRAREIYAAQFPGDAGFETREWIMDGSFGEEETIRAIVAALTPPEGYVSREEMLDAQDRAFYDGIEKAIPDGYVLVQVADAERLCRHVLHSPSSSLAARRVEAIIKAARGIA